MQCLVLAFFAPMPLQEQEALEYAEDFRDHFESVQDVRFSNLKLDVL